MLGLTVTETTKEHLCAALHSFLDEDLNAGGLLLNGHSIEADYLSLVFNHLSDSAVELNERAIYSYKNIFERSRWRLVHSTEGGSKVRAIIFSALGFADVVEQVGLQEDPIKNFIAVVLILVAASSDTVWALDTRA